MLGHRAHAGNPLFHLVDDSVICPGQELDQVSAGCRDGQIRVHQNTQGAGCGDLLTLSKVGGDVLCDLTGDQGHRSHIGFL